VPKTRVFNAGVWDRDRAALKAPEGITDTRARAFRPLYDDLHESTYTTVTCVMVRFQPMFCVHDEKMSEKRCESHRGLSHLFSPRIYTRTASL